MSMRQLHDLSRVYLEQVASVDEAVKGADNELRRAASAERRVERAAETEFRRKGRVGVGKKGPKLSTTPHGKSEVKNYADKEMSSIKLYDKATKRNKNIVGLVTKEALEVDMKKRQEQNEKAREEMKKTAAYKSMAATAAKKFDEAAKPDYLDFDKDGNKEESMKKALKDKKKVEEAIDPKGAARIDAAKQKKSETKDEREKRLMLGKYSPSVLYAKHKVEEALDPVGQEDDDVDNDGDLDSSDQYLKKRRKAIGKAIAVRKEGYSNWRQDLSEVMDKIAPDERNEKQIKEKKIQNKIIINPELKEAVEEIGGTLLEMVELDEAVYGGEKEEPKDDRMVVTAADKRGNTSAYQKFKAGHKGYKAAEHLKNEEVEVEEGYKPIDREKESAMYRRAGNLARTSLSSRGKKKEEAQTKSSKIVSAITRQKEKERFDRIGQSPAHNEEFEQIDEKCWPGYKKKGMKTMFGKRYPNCVKKEEVELDEKTLTPAETKKKEEIVKSMKKSAGDFEKRYPGRGKEVMYATATKQAKKVAEAVANQVALSPQELQKQKQKATLDTQIAMLRKQSLSKAEKPAVAKEEYIDERRKEEKVAGTPREKTDRAYELVKQSIRRAEGTPRGQQKKVPGKKPPKAGDYGGPLSPAQRVAIRRASAQRSKDMISSRFD